MEADVNYDSICIPSKDILAFEIEGNKMLVPLEAGIVDFDDKICTLSGTGWAIWHKLNERQTLGQIAEALAEDFFSPVDEIGRDVLGFAAEMRRCGACKLLNDNHLQRPRGMVTRGTSDEVKHPGQVVADVQSAEQPLSAYIIYGGEIKLSNQGQLKLLRSMKDRGVSLRTMVRGTSMHPFIQDRDVLTIVPLRDQLPGAGDVVAFRQSTSGSLVIHRAIKQTDSGWVIKGDNHLGSDGVVPADEIIGFVTHIERKGSVVRFGLGIESKLIAFLNRGKGLYYLKFLCSIPRRTVRLIKHLAMG